MCADARGAKKKGQGDILQVEPEATPELKEAVEVSIDSGNLWFVAIGLLRCALWPVQTINFLLWNFTL